MNNPPSLPKPSFPNLQPKIHRNHQNQPNTNNTRPPLLVIHPLNITALSDLIDPADVQDEAVQEHRCGEDGEGPRGGEGDGVVAEVEERGGDGAEDDGEF